MDRSFVTLALALAASLAAPAALADRNNPPRGGDRYVAESADELRLAAESLVKAVGRERDPSSVHVIMSAGMLAKEASDLACAAGLRLQTCRQQPRGIRAEFQDVKQAFQSLKAQMRHTRLGSRSEDLYQDVVYAFQDLRDATGGGGGGGGGGRDDDFDDDGYSDDDYDDQGDDGYDDDGYDDDNYDDDDYDDQGDDLDDYDDFYPDNNGPDHNRGGGR